MTTATAQDWLRFLRPVALAVRNTPTEDDAKARASALAFALRVPASALTASRQRDLCRKCEFWPSIAEIEALFADAWCDAARSRAIATAGGATLLPAPQRVDLTDAEREAMQHKAAAVAAELRARTHAGPAPRPEPRTLGPRDLLASYEASGTPAALFRAQQLRRQLDGEA